MFAAVFVLSPPLLLALLTIGGLSSNRDMAPTEPRVLSEQRTAAPIATPAPSRSPNLIYAETRLAQFQRLGDVVTRTAALFNNASTQPTLFTDAGWRRQIAVALAEMKAGGDQLIDYKPVPPAAAATDSIVVGLGRDFKYVADEYAAGLDKLDAPRIASATRWLSDMTPAVQRARDGLVALSKT